MECRRNCDCGPFVWNAEGIVAVDHLYGIQKELWLIVSMNTLKAHLKTLYFKQAFVVLEVTFTDV